MRIRRDWRETTTRTWRGLGACVGGLLLATALAAEPPEPEAGREPVPLRILAPGHLLVYQPSPTSAHVLEPGRVQARFELSESNVLHPSNDPRGIFDTEVDLELSRFQMAFDLGLTERWQLGMEVPFLYFHSGWMDHGISEVESFFGKLKPRRREEDQNQFTYLSTVEGETILRGLEDELGLGDVVFSAQRSLKESADDGLAVALRAAVKLPTGDDETGFGSGVVDLGLGTVLEWRPGVWTVTGGLNVSVPLEQTARLRRLHAMPTLSGWAEASRTLGRRLAGHVQLAWATQPFDEDLGIALRQEGENRTFTGHVVQVTPALSWRFDSGRTLYFGLVEDFLTSGDTALDVTVFFALRLPVQTRLF